jgi:NADH-quinone oxidoreductase subunit C/D
MDDGADIGADLRGRFGAAVTAERPAPDETATFRVARSDLMAVLGFLKNGVTRPYSMLFDLTAVDNRLRRRRTTENEGDFSVVYHLLSIERNADVRIRTTVPENGRSVPSATGLWRNADWYEREIWDMFGIVCDGHPDLRRILMPETWHGHPLCKDHPARATELPSYHLTRQEAIGALMKMQPPAKAGDDGYGGEGMVLNVGPHHPGTHGPLRMILRFDGELITEAAAEIGFHHRGAEKMAERQTWHTYIPYTDRVDYLGGVNNNLPYVMAVEKLAGITAPPRAQTIRVLLCELFRISSHLVFYGTLAQDLGALSPVFYMFTDRERVLEIIESICGARMHPGWFRIGGVAQDLPSGWEELVMRFVRYFPSRLREYDALVLESPLFKARTRGVGAYTLSEAVEWGVTGPGLRACGLAWDFRKKRPYSGYERFEFDVPTAHHGDCYDRAVIHAEEMRQSLRIIEQCVRNMPGGTYKASHPLATPPLKDKTTMDIETLIGHFLGVSWGPRIPPGEAWCVVEATKGANAYYLVSDGDISAYRARIRSPSFAHVQMVPSMCKGMTISDLIAVLGAVDFVLGDVDR